MDVASGADRYLGITFEMQSVESSSHVSILFRVAISHPSTSIGIIFVCLFYILPKLFYVSVFKITG